jgi:hypothetical protein
MNFEDDFESTTWRRPGVESSLYVDDIDELSEDRPVIVIPEETEERQFFQSHKANRRGPQPKIGPFSSSGTLSDEYAYEIDVITASKLRDFTDSDLDLSIQDELGRPLPKHLENIVASVEQGISVGFEQRPPPSYRPPVPIPKLAEAKSDFLKRVSAKRSEIRSRDLERSRAEVESERLKQNLQNITEELREAQDKLQRLERGIV